MAVDNLSWNIGSHVKWEGNFYNTLHKAINSGMYSFQAFMGNPKSFVRSEISESDIQATQNLLNRFPTFVFTHAPYLYNLSGSKDCLAWNGDSTQDEKTMKVLESLEYELNIVANFSLKGNGVIVHPGNHTDREAGLAAISKSINKIKFNDNAMLLLENSAGQGTSLATTFKEIYSIYKNIDEDKKKYIGVCVDTAHIFGYGEYDISKLSEMKRMISEFLELFDISKLKLIHLNDSKAPCKSRKDRHELIGEGLIWRESKESLLYLLQFCKENQVPLVLETEPEDMEKFFKM